MSGPATPTPTFADVNRDVLRTLEPPSNRYFAWMCVVALVLAGGILAWAGQVWWGIGMAGKPAKVVFDDYILGKRGVAFMW